MTLRLLTVVFLSISFATIAKAQVFDFPPSAWGKIDLNLAQSTMSGAESILGSSAKWEKLNTFKENTRERRFSRPVGRLQIRFGDSVGVCTGFLISKNELMTNNHCIPGNGKPIRQAELVMGYYNEGSLEGVETFDVNIQPIITNRDLDFGVLRVRGEPGVNWGFLNFSGEKPSEGDRLMVIHHPAGQVKHITTQGCVAGRSSEGNKNDLLHRCDTVPGSSGSPILDQDGQVVALHYAGTTLVGPGAFNFAKVATSIQVALLETEKSTPDEIDTFSELDELKVFEVYKDTAINVDEGYVSDCEQLSLVRDVWVTERDIRRFTEEANKCFEMGAISKFTHDKLATKAEAMSANYGVHTRELARNISCRSIIDKIDKGAFENWSIRETHVSAFCGLNSEESAKLSAYLKLNLEGDHFELWVSNSKLVIRGAKPRNAVSNAEIFEKAGLILTDVSSEYRSEAARTNQAPGVFISNVVAGSDAEREGVRAGDVISYFDGDRVESLTYLVDRSKEIAPSRRVNLLIRKFDGGSFAYLMSPEFIAQ